MAAENDEKTQYVAVGRDDPGAGVHGRRGAGIYLDREPDTSLNRRIANEDIIQTA